MLSCLAGEDAERLFRRDGEAYSGIARRLVVVRAATAIDGHAGTRLKDALVRAAGCTECLRGLCMVVSQGALIGVYRDTGLSLSRQRRAWAEVIDAVSAGWRLTVAVGAAVSESEDFPVQHRLVPDNVPRPLPNEKGGQWKPKKQDQQSQNNVRRAPSVSGNQRLGNRREQHGTSAYAGHHQR